MERRSFMKKTGVVVPGAIALSMLNTRWVFGQAADFNDDVEVLNYALTLEYLEAEFYKQGNAANLLTAAEKTMLERIGADEATHVTAITDTIKQRGGTPVAAPSVDFGDSFETRNSYLEAAYTFENTGVHAYLGAAGFIKDKKILTAAASIFGVEARHAGVIGEILKKPVTDGVFLGSVETPLTKAEVLEAVKPFIKG
jgi:rubrerythrin